MGRSLFGRKVTGLGTCGSLWALIDSILNSSARFQLCCLAGWLAGWLTDWLGWSTKEDRRAREEDEGIDGTMKRKEHKMGKEDGRARNNERNKLIVFENHGKRSPKYQRGRCTMTSQQPLFPLRASNEKGLGTEMACGFLDAHSALAA